MYPSCPTDRVGVRIEGRAFRDIAVKPDRALLASHVGLSAVGAEADWTIRRNAQLWQDRITLHVRHKCSRLIAFGTQQIQAGRGVRAGPSHSVSSFVEKSGR